MSELAVAVIAGTVLFVISAVVSLAVWAIKAQIKNESLEREKAQGEERSAREKGALELELRIAREYLDPVIKEFRELIADLREQLHLRDELRNGFATVHKRLGRRTSDEENQPS